LLDDARARCRSTSRVFWLAMRSFPARVRRQRAPFPPPRGGRSRRLQLAIPLDFLGAHLLVGSDALGIQRTLLRDTGLFHGLIGGNACLVDGLVAGNLTAAGLARPHRYRVAAICFSRAIRAASTASLAAISAASTACLRSISSSRSACPRRSGLVDLGGLQDAHAFDGLARGDLGFVQRLLTGDLALRMSSSPLIRVCASSRSCAIRRFSFASFAAISASRTDF
jgi:hypothetical protein